MTEVVHEPLDLILHASAARLKWTGFALCSGNIFFWLVWTQWLPQPFESAPVRFTLSISGLLFFSNSINRDVSARWTVWMFSVVCFVSMPVFFFWMYWMNQGNAVWLASVCGMLLIYYNLTDWRAATMGSCLGLILGWAFSYLMAQETMSLPPENLLAIAFAWVSAVLLGLSSANLRRTRLINTLSTMAVMAHELRTPLATVNLMGDVLRTLARNDVPEGKRKKIEELSTRLQNLVRSMNRQIDTQISNAQLLRLPREQSPVMAGDLVSEVINNYPYRSTRERDCVRLHIQEDFCFVASRPLFMQVVTNLLKNALHSLASASTAPNPGDLRIDVGVHRGKGRIAVSDDGVGIAHDQQARIFEPFFSTQAGAGNGLGLTFCKNVVEAAHGTISVHSVPTMGAVFMVDLPIYRDAH
jgi:signal transduction histidine kinase